MLEAMILLDQKVPMEVIDKAAEDFGMPMGPIELADTVGLDICMAVGDSLRAKLGDALPPTPDWLRDKVHKGELGRKTGKGFYVWKDGKAQKAGAMAPSSGPQSNMTPGAGTAGQPSPSEMADRLIPADGRVWCSASLRWRGHRPEQIRLWSMAP